MRYFLDTEFIEYPGCIDLISIGIVSEVGDRFYAESSEVDWSKASDWVLKNVRPHLRFQDEEPDLYPLGGRGLEPDMKITAYYGPKKNIGRVLDDWVDSPHPEFWAYYADYDWVAFCWLFGTMLELPERFPKFCRDVKQLACEVHTRLPLQTTTEHNALYDAQWTMEAYEHLMKEKNFYAMLDAAHGAN